MSLQPTIGKLSRVDFFAVLIPGFYILSNFLFLIFYLTSEKPSALLSSLKDISTVIWVPLTLLFLMFSYVIGSLPRAFPVTMTDNFCAKIFNFWRKLFIPKSEYKRDLHSGIFPYPNALRHQLEILLDLEIFINRSQNPGDIKIKLPDNDDPNCIVLFDY